MSLPGWQYTKNKYVVRVSGEVTNYQMKLLVGESSGSVGADIHCEGLCLSTFNDLRFTNSNDELLSYWIESISGTTPNQVATVWIRIDVIHTISTKISMYYGNPSAPVYSSITDTFRTADGHFGDDFERGSNGDPVGGAWTNTAIVGVANASISTDHSVSGTRCVKMSGNNTQYISVPLTHSDNIAIRVKFWRESGISDIRFWHGESPGNGQVYPWIASSNEIYYSNSSGSYDTGKSAKVDEWDEIEICNFDWDSNTYDLYYTDYDLAEAGISSTQVSVNAPDSLWLYNWGSASGDVYFDNMIVRNYRADEPVWVEAPTYARATGGTITYTDENGLNPRSNPPYENGYVVHTFTSSGNLEIIEGGTVECLIVAGGGAGSSPILAWEGAGGGAGGVIQSCKEVTVGTSETLLFDVEFESDFNDSINDITPSPIELAYLNSEEEMFGNQCCKLVPQADWNVGYELSGVTLSNPTGNIWGAPIYFIITGGSKYLSFGVDEGFPGYDPVEITGSGDYTLSVIFDEVYNTIVATVDYDSLPLVKMQGDYSLVHPVLTYDTSHLVDSFVANGFTFSSFEINTVDYDPEIEGVGVIPAYTIYHEAIVIKKLGETGNYEIYMFCTGKGGSIGTFPESFIITQFTEINLVDWVLPSGVGLGWIDGIQILQGALWTENFTPPTEPFISSIKKIVVGDGGVAGIDVIVNGENSTFEGLISVGGGGGAAGGAAGGDGGSGGGAVYITSGGNGVDGQGYDGETCDWSKRGCGGGGAGELGGTNHASYGGDGIESLISGTVTYYGGGGGGLGWDGSYFSGQGGSGGGGNAASTLAEVGQAGTSNTGGGGGGGSWSGGTSYLGGNGGSGIVIIRYLYTPESVESNIYLQFFGRQYQFSNLGGWQKRFKYKEDEIPPESCNIYLPFRHRSRLFNGAGFLDILPLDRPVVVPPTVTFEGDPLILEAWGDPAVLTWEITNAYFHYIDQGIGDVPLIGSMTVYPIDTTTYTLTAIGDAFSTVTATVTILVPPYIELVSDTYLLLQYNDPVLHPNVSPVNLSWDSTSAVTIYLNDPDDPGYVSVPSGTKLLYPTEKTIYTVTATNDDGIDSTASVKIIAVLLTYEDTHDHSIFGSEQVVLDGAELISGTYWFPDVVTIGTTLPEWKFSETNVNPTQFPQQFMVVHTVPAAEIWYTLDRSVPIADSTSSYLYTTTLIFDDNDWDFDNFGFPIKHIRVNSYARGSDEYSEVKTSVEMKRIQTGIIEPDPISDPTGLIKRAVTVEGIDSTGVFEYQVISIDGGDVISGTLTYVAPPTPVDAEGPYEDSFEVVTGEMVAGTMTLVRFPVYYDPIPPTTDALDISEPEFIEALHYDGIIE